MFGANATNTGIADTIGNAISGGFTTGQIYTIDQPPTVISINRQSPATANTAASSVTYRIIFSEAVTGVNPTDFSMVVTGTVAGNLASNAVVMVGTDGTTYDVTVTSVAGNGTLRLNLNATNTGITDTIGNAIGGGFTTGQTYTIDQPPIVLSINRQSPVADTTTRAIFANT